MPFITRLQSYLRHSAHQQYEAVAVPPFTLFFHRTDALRFFNYAIPDEPITGKVQTALAELKTVYFARQRQPRFEFIEEFAPSLAAKLKAADFVQEGRYPLMVCTPETVRPAPTVDGLTITTLTVNSSLDDAQAYIATQREGWDPANTQPVTREDAEQLLQTSVRTAVCFLACLHGQPASVGVFTQPFDGVTEIAGVATLLPLRRRGLATALTEYAVRTAFAQGVEIACLSAGDEQASRVYERVGFCSRATMLAYSVPTR